MTQQTSPFVESKYGWSFGESGWNTGADENWLKFGFLHDNNVEDVVASLPTAINGTAYFLTTDNRFYFAVGTSWYSSPCPKWFIFKVRSTGMFWQFDGASAVEINNPQQANAALEAIQDVIDTLGTAAFVSLDSLATQAELDVAAADAAAYTDDLRSDLAASTAGLGAELVGYDTGTVSSAIDALRAQVINVLDYGADPTGVADSSAAFTAAWAAMRALANPTTRYINITLKIPAGVYRANSTIDFTAVFDWNLGLEAEGAYIIGYMSGSPVVDMTGTRGLTCRGLSILGDSTAVPSCGLLVGPAELQTSGNCRFTNLKIDGYFSVTACWNIGCETTIWDFCYFQNRTEGADKYAYLGDSVNRFGASSAFTTTRAANTWASLTCNVFYSCRFANYGGGPCSYVEGVFNWSWDVGCYHLSFGDSGIVIRCSSLGLRSTNLKIEGLFETAAGGAYGGLKDCVRIVSEDSLQTDIRGFYLNAGQPQASRSIIRLENTSGVELTTPSMVKIANAEILVSKTINVATVTPVFSGARLQIQGDLKLRESPMVNLDTLEGFQGTLYTLNYADVTQPGSTDKPFSYFVFEETGNSGRIIRVDGVSNGLGFQAGSNARISAQGATSTNIELVPGTSGSILIGTTTPVGSEKLTIGTAGMNSAGPLVSTSSAKFELPVQIGGYTLATLPSAATYIRHLIIVTDATGGAAICRSNGTNWIDLHTKATVA